MKKGCIHIVKANNFDALKKKLTKKIKIKKPFD